MTVCADSSGGGADEFDGVEVLHKRSSVPLASLAPAAQAAAFSERGGSSFLAVVIGVPIGRWTSELSGQQPACQIARASLSRLRGQFALPTDCPGVVAGIVAFRGWRCVTGVASHAQTFALMSACQSHHSRRSGQRFIEHEVLASAQVSSINGHIVADRSWLREHTGSRCLARDAATAFGWQCSITKGDKLGYQFALRDLIDRWRSCFGIASAELVAWPVDFRLAVAMARGAWWGDVSVKHRRQLPGETSMAPVRPSDTFLRLFLEHRVGEVAPPETSVTPPVWGEKKGAVRPFHPEHIVASARACADVSNKAKLKQVLLASARWWAPGLVQSIAQCQRHIDDAPAANTQRRHIIMLDIASMLARRQWYKLSGPTFRYLSFDASPQGGQEYFVSVERVVKRSDVREVSAELWPPVESRVLPLCTLGCGRMGLADKVQTHLHQVWLEYGPSIRSVRAANLDVRQCLSDMGTELAIGDALDCVPACVGQSEASSAVDSQGYLYPLALVVPGPQHILDTCLTRGLDMISWWPEWQRLAKTMCQWLRPANRRSLLGQKLREAGGAPDELASRLKALEKSCESFAAWRWKTLSSVTSDLSRLEDSVRCVLSSVTSAAQLSSRDSGEAASFVESGRDPEFWARNAMLSKVTGPIAAFSSWLQGCPCHEEDRLAGRKVVCQWAGCRAPALATRLAAAFAELQVVRDDSYSSPEIVAAVNAILGNLRMKMAWVWEEPYLVWRAHEPSVAQELIAKHDAMISQGKSPHRVTSYLCGVGSLRADMLAYAGGGGLSERLRVELRAYSLCKLDDTWAESIHRDISCLTKRAVNCRPMYVAAKLRLPQTLASLDGIALKSRLAYNECLQRFKAICQLNPQRAARLVPSRMPLKDVLARVYRCDAVALRNWGSELGVVSHCLADGQRKRGVVARLQIEYLSSIITDGQLLSLPLLSESVLGQVEKARPSERSDMLLVATQQGGEDLFVVVDKAAGRKKRLRTSSCLAAQMVLPVTVQRVTRRAHARDLVFHDGCPELVDLLPRAAWSVWRFGLRQWSTIASDTQGSLVLSDSAPVVASADWKDSSAPTLLLLEQLASRGWTRGSPPEAHTVDSPKLFNVADPLAAKAYVRCLVGLPELLAIDLDFAALPSAEVVGYYQCVLLSDKPSQVAIGESSAQYRAALKALTGGCGEESHAAIVDADVALPIVDADADADVELCVRSSLSVQSPVKRTAGSSCALAKGEPKRKLARREGQSDWQAIVFAEAPAPVAILPGPSASSNDAFGSAESAAAEQSQIVASGASGSMQASSAPLAAGQLRFASRGEFDRDRCFVEGIQVAQEAHGIVDMPGSYRRCIVRCPYHAGSKQCGKKRNFGVRASVSSGLGDAEPYAFLGAWLRAHAAFGTAEAHCRYTPSAGEVSAYAREVGITAPAE